MCLQWPCWHSEIDELYPFLQARAWHRRCWNHVVFVFPLFFCSWVYADERGPDLCCVLTLDLCFTYWSCSSNDLLWLQCSRTGEWCFVALRMLTVWMLDTAEVKLCRLHLFLHLRGIFPLPPTLHQGTRRWMKMLDWMRTDCKSCCSTLRKASATEMIFLLSLSVWMTQRSPSSSQVENIFNRAPPVWQHYYTWNEAWKRTAVY